MPGCTNHGCFIEPKKAVGTNGPCHCLDNLGKENSLALRKRICLMMETIKAQQKMIVAYRVGQTSLPESVFDALEKARTFGLIA